MSQEAKQKLASLLDTDLEELQKSIAADNEDEQEDNEEENESAEDQSSEDDDHEEEETDEDDSDEEDEDQSDDDDDAAGESTLRKSLAASGQEQAFEVSDFLTAIADEIGFGLEGVEKSMMSVTKQNNAIVKSLATFGDVMQKAMTTIEEQAEKIDSLEKSLAEVMNRPVGRKGVVTQREVQTLSKSLNNGQAPRKLNRSQVSDILVKSAVDGDIPHSAVSRFEAGVPLESLGLSADYLQKSFGL